MAAGRVQVGAWQGPQDATGAVEVLLWERRGDWLTSGEIEDALRSLGRRFPPGAVEAAIAALWEGGAVHARPGRRGRLYAGTRTFEDLKLFSRLRRTP